jgi:hypothetical protein
MNLEIETEAAQFLLWEYINGILVAVFTYMQFFLLLLFICRKDDIDVPQLDRVKRRRRRSTGGPDTSVRYSAV